MDISIVKFLEMKLLAKRYASINLEKIWVILLMFIHHLNIKDGVYLLLSPATCLTSKWENSELWSLPVPARLPWYSWATWSHGPRRSPGIPWFARKRWCSWINGSSGTPRCQRIKRYLVCMCKQINNRKGYFLYSHPKLI